MKSILRRRPSPALVISMVALFVSLSGVSYGVATGFIDSREIQNNEVRSIDIRNNEVRTRDIRNNEVRGRDIRNSTIRGFDVGLNTLGGLDINEANLGKVPSATSADTATTATNAAGLKLIPQTTLAEGAPAVTLATHGSLTLRGACEPGAAAATDATLAVASTEDNAAAGGETLFEPDLDAAEGPFTITILSDAAAPPKSIALSRAFASAPSGKAFTGQVALHSDASGAGSCVFHGHLALQG